MEVIFRFLFFFCLFFWGGVKLKLQLDILSFSCYIGLRSVLHNPIGDKSSLVQVINTRRAR